MFSVDAFRKITFAEYSVVSCVSASMTRTPVARPVFGSVMMLCAIECGRSVMLPVAAAAGSVDELLEKYAPYGQPRWHRFRALAGAASIVRLADSTATRLLIRRRSANCVSSCSRKCFSMQFISNGGCSLPSGSCGRPGVLAADADELLDVVVPGLDVLVADRPVDADALARVGLEVQIAPAEAVPRPQQRPAAHLIAAIPAEVLHRVVGVIDVLHEEVLRVLAEQIERRSGRDSPRGPAASRGCRAAAATDRASPSGSP